MADDDRGDRRLEPNTAEWFADNRRRYGNPHGVRDRTAEGDDDARTGAFHPRADVSELVEMLHGMRVGENAAAPPVKPKVDLSFNIPTMLAILAMVGTGFTALNNFESRLSKAEVGVQDGKDRAVRYVPIIEALRESIQGQTSENKMQNDRINSIVDALADERRARNADGVETRKAQQDIMALIAKLADKVSDIGTDVAVIKSGGRRSEMGPPEHDAQLRPR